MKDWARHAEATLPQLPFRDSCVYGPVFSRRLGTSLGINLLPTDRRVCSFACAYCQVPRPTRPHDWREEANSLPDAETLLQEIRDGFERAVEADTPLDVISLAGNGDPSVHPEFHCISQGIRQLRDELLPGVDLVVLTNCFPPRPSLGAALKHYDRVLLKLDAGDTRTWQRLDRPLEASDLPAHVGTIASWGLENLEVQTMVAGGMLSNLDSLRGPGFLDLVQQLAPSAVHLYTINKLQAEPGAHPVSAVALEDLRAHLAAQITAPVHAWWGAAKRLDGSPATDCP